MTLLVWPLSHGGVPLRFFKRELSIRSTGHSGCGAFGLIATLKLGQTLLGQLQPVTEHSSVLESGYFYLPLWSPPLGLMRHSKTYMTV